MNLPKYGPIKLESHDELMHRFFRKARCITCGHSEPHKDWIEYRYGDRFCWQLETDVENDFWCKDWEEVK